MLETKLGGDPKHFDNEAELPMPCFFVVVINLVFNLVAFW